MSQFQINTQKLVSYNTILSRNVFIESNNGCESLIVHNTAYINGDLQINSLQGLTPESGLELNGLTFKDTGIDMDCHNFLNVGMYQTDSINAKSDVIDVRNNMQFNGPEMTNKILWEGGIQLGNTDTDTVDSTGISLGYAAKAGPESIAIGDMTGNLNGSSNITIGKCSGLQSTGNKNINIGTDSTSIGSVNNAITVGCNAISNHEGAIVLGPGTSCAPNILHLNFPSGGDLKLDTPSLTENAYFPICVNGRKFYVVGYINDCFNSVIMNFNITFPSPIPIQGRNSIDGNYQLLGNITDKYTGTTNPLGGFLVLYSAPGESNPGPEFNYVSGLRIINFSSAVPQTLPMYNVPYSLYLPANINPNPTQECPNGWNIRNIPIQRWIDANNINVVITPDGTSMDITWDPVTDAEEYAVSVTVEGEITSTTVTHYYGKLVSGTSVTLDTTRDVSSTSYWNNVTNVTTRVVGYQLCDKSLTVSNNCVIAPIVPILENNIELCGRFSLSPYQLTYNINDMIVIGTPNLASIVITNIQVPQTPGPVMELVSFSGWSSYQYSPIINPPFGTGVWTISPGGYTVTQTSNVEPPIHLSGSDLDLCDYVVQINATPITSGNGYVGFTIGYTPGDEININADYLIVVWIGGVGTRLYRQQGLFMHTLGLPNSWVSLGSGLTKGVVPWVLGQTHTWRFDSTGKQLKIYIDNILEFDLPWTFVNGSNIGLLAYLQTIRYDNGYRWFNVCPPCTKTTVSNWVADTSGITATADNLGLITVTAPFIERAVRIGQTVNGQLSGTSNIGYSYLGFKCNNYLNYLETITMTQTVGNPGGNQANTTRLSSFVSNVNKRYLFVVKGITDFALGGVAKRDARYLTWTFPTGWTLLTGTDAYRIDNANMTTPAVYNDDHQYYDVRSGTGTVFQMTYLDSDYFDNVGTITTDIYEICSTGPLVSGLFGRRYVNYFSDNVTWFNTATRHGQTVISTSINNFTSSADNYSWEWNGFFRPSSTGTWTFYTASDDASYLWIGNTAVSGFTTGNATVNNGGLHGTIELSGSVSLTAGVYYPIRIQFGELGGGDIMTVSFAGPSVAKTTNGNGFYFHPSITY